MDYMEIMNIVCYVVTIASVITRITPSKKDDKIVGKILEVVKALSMPPKDKAQK